MTWSPPALELESGMKVGSWSSIKARMKRRNFGAKRIRGNVKGPAPCYVNPSLADRG